MYYAFVVFTVVLLSAWYLRRWSLAVGPEQTKRTLKKFGIGALVVLAVALAIRSGSALAALLPVLLVAARRFWHVFTMLARWTPLSQWLSRWLSQRTAQSGMPPNAGTSGAGAYHSTSGNQRSTITTQFFVMILDQGQGSLDGEVIAGSKQGQQLSQLSLSELMALHQEVAVDPQSQAVLETFLDYRFGDNWRQQSGNTQKPDMDLNADLTPAQAYAVLGLSVGASKTEIRQAHRRLSQRLHPDHGGNDALCSLINRARDVLLKS